MSVKFEDYYQILGSNRDATADELQSAYRRQARKYHPDISKEQNAEEQFKKVNEAYEVLKDPESRRRYDALGANWKSGQDFRPPPGWNPFGGGGQQAYARSGTGNSASFEDIFGQANVGAGAGGDFSDFFNVFFGQRGQAQSAQRDTRAGSSQARRGTRGAHREAELLIGIEDLYHSKRRQVSVPVTRHVQGREVTQTKTYTVRIPPGTVEGSTIRLAKQGAPGNHGGEPGDLLLRIKIAPDARFDHDAYDLSTSVPLTPWEAALGARVAVPTVDGEVTLTVPSGVASGKRLRLRGKGLPINEEDRGDLYAELSIVNPKELTDEERELYVRLAEVSDYNPRT